ncbi:4'-phosphopantetheinyl transferase [Agromyces ramosus]|uniref:4'-phosphopantetheinyl transferase n=1 Tax=Agromyces ramosus TaxID=33879 RepID=A0A4Q7MPT4_9MICO|nr:4'-phosphopantetheinyl transferase [Agromyces ramosus]
MTGGSGVIGGGVRLAWADPAEFDLARAWRLLAPAEVARATEIADAARRNRFLLGRMLLRDLAADAGGLPPERVTVTAACERCGGEHGRPALRWPDAAGPPPNVTVASCPRLVVAALAPPGIRVGVDVEPRRAPPGHEPARRTELAAVLGGPSRSAVRRWVRAEAVLKADGRGLRVDPASVVVRRRLARIGGEPAPYRIVDRRIADCLVSVAAGPAPR